MRKRMVAGNWKMNMDHKEGAGLAEALLRGLEGREPWGEVVVIPPFTSLFSVIQVLGGSAVRTGAQDIHQEDSGAYTGEISGAMMRALGCDYVLVGHSERRHKIGEGGGLLALKLRAALRSGLNPIYCVGELAEERDAGRAEGIVVAQLHEVLAGLKREEISSVVVAYEPVWAIGTGRNATPDDAAEMHRVIRMELSRIFDSDVASGTTILYGGSVNPNNAHSLLGMEEIDGVLVGGASLTAGTFLGILFA